MLKGKTALVTGAGKGIGRATAILLAKNGAAVVVCSRTIREAEETAGEIRSQGGVSLALECDVSDEKSVVTLFAEVKKNFGGLDILVNNAGLFSSGLVEETSLEEFNRLLAVNVGGVFLCCREAFKLMRPKVSGSIVNVSSLSGVKGAKKFPGFGAYCASKFGVVGLTEVLAVEGAECGIRVNAVCPGAVDTEMLKKAFPGDFPKLRPEQVAETILFLAGPKSSGVSGTCAEMYSDLLK
ncbi:MAG: SDR family oxidoreductase [Nitrospinae bacterium]|nr:SDR family oxidoreductase [Nitrospinota bacterium]